MTGFAFFYTVEMKLRSLQLLVIFFKFMIKKIKQTVLTTGLGFYVVFHLVPATVQTDFLRLNDFLPQC
jgi:hypothetical protein